MFCLSDDNAPTNPKSIWASSKTDLFVNIVMNGGYYGFSGICAMAEQMCDAVRHPKDRKPLLSHKGFGCESCLA